MNLTPLQHDVLRELINIGIGKAAGLINQMVKAHVQLDIPEILAWDSQAFEAFLAQRGETPLSSVRLGFKGGFSGWAGLLFPKSSANWLVNQLVGGDFDTSTMDMDSLYVGTIQEVGNIVLNGVMGAIVNVLNLQVDYFPPDYQEISLRRLFTPQIDQRNMVLLIKTRLALESGVVEGEIIIIFQVATFETLLTAIDTIIQRGALA
ncbi:chemotaxis protein CheC [Fundidesulfovibrio agrisoli]|uniref:chemotaxis protein CheC n=1 Tax=Fundidesulfovibrio agrisoli TaxID=2922717 RepID=UPI001FAB9AE9|nr:chemotaxis protein CheC [Fundidesulfovibrio agrisoli]